MTQEACNRETFIVNPEAFKRKKPTKSLKRMRKKSTMIMNKIFNKELNKMISALVLAGDTAYLRDKNLKGLHQENLRDNMTNEELVMNSWLS